MNFLNSIQNALSKTQPPTHPPTPQYKYLMDGTDSAGFTFSATSYISTGTQLITPLGLTTKYLNTTNTIMNTGARLPISSLSIPSTGFTINFNFRSTGTANHGRIFECWNNTSSYFYIAVMTNYLSIGSENADYNSIYSGVNINDNVWRNLSVVVKVGGLVDLYVNKSKVVSNYAITYPASSYSNVYFSQSDGTGKGFNGGLYNFQFFNRVLTSSEILLITDPNLTATPVITLTGRTATSLSFSVSTTDNYSSMIYKIYYGTGVYISSTTSTATITGLSPSSKYDIYAVVTKDSSSSPSSNILSAVQTFFYAAPIQTADATYAATSTGTTTAADTLVVSGATFTHANGTFVFSGSSCCSNTWLANRVFNNVAAETNLWTCSSVGGINLYGLVYTQNAYAAGNYQGGGALTRTQSTTVSGTAYGGEWLQVQLPYSFVAKQLEIYNRSPATGGSAIRYPKNVIWAGSNDGSTWNLISNPTYDGTQMNTVTTVSSNTTAYNYFRVIINSNYNGGIINFYSIRYYGCLA